MFDGKKSNNKTVLCHINPVQVWQTQYKVQKSLGHLWRCVACFTKVIIFPWPQKSLKTQEWIGEFPVNQIEFTWSIKLAAFSNTFTKHLETKRRSMVIPLDTSLNIGKRCRLVKSVGRPNPLSYTFSQQLLYSDLKVWKKRSPLPLQYSELREPSYMCFAYTLVSI